MKVSKGINPVMRAVGVFSAVAIIAGGATYAALSSSVTLTDSSITTANAELQVYNFAASDENPAGWSDTAPGFVITDLIPGEGVEKSFYLRNSGAVDLEVKAKVPALPAAPDGGEYGFSGFENVKVWITGEACAVEGPSEVEPLAVGPNVVVTDLLALSTGDGVPLPCNPLEAGAAGDSNTEGTAGNYDIKFDINPEAITGDSAGVGDFDIVFTGTAVASETES